MIVNAQITNFTHWGWVTHICVGNLNTISSDNDLSPGRRQAIIWTNAGILFTGPLIISFRKMLLEINTFSFTKMHLKWSSANLAAILFRPQCVKKHCQFTGVHHLVETKLLDFIDYKWFGIPFQLTTHCSNWPKSSTYNLYLSKCDHICVGHA